MSGSTKTNGFTRWLKFNLVGVGGVVVQLGLLEVWTYFSLGNYLLGTAAAVEGAILHNFGWHCVYTWRDRPAGSRAGIALRLLRFHLANGVVSLVGNLALMQVLVSAMRLPVLAANATAIVACSLVNYCLGDRWVFRGT